MIAIISSTIFPDLPAEATLYRGSIDYADRLAQTVTTIKSLQSLGFTKIYLFDNSGFNWDEQADPQLAPAEVIKFNSFQYNNKGLSELMMLLHGMQKIASDQPVLKISGRYVLSEKIDEMNFSTYDFAGKFHADTISTRAYYFKNSDTMKAVLFAALNNMYSYKHRIVGLRSLVQVAKNAFLRNVSTSFYDTTISIERGMFNAIKKLKLKSLHLEKLNVSGISGHHEDQQKSISE